MESVFIAWSGNLPLAREVQVLLEKRGFRIVIGGNTPNDMYIGSQIIAQMNSCNHAIILAQKKPGHDLPEFSDNLMFEWGYLNSKLGSGRMSVYLIDTDERELPSDLIGSWVIPVRQVGKTLSEIAQEISDSFHVERRALDKLDIIANWRDVKTAIANYTSHHTHSDSEIAQYALFSVLSAYYHDEVDYFLGLLGQVRTSSHSLRATIEEAQAMLRVYSRTANLAKPLKMADYFEVITQLQSPFEEYMDEGDPDLAQWAKIMRVDRSHLCNSIMAMNSEGTEASLYHNEAIRLGLEALDLIEKNLFDFPDNRYYAALLRSFLHRNLAMSYNAIGSEELSLEHLTKSVERREEFYFRYLHDHPEDAELCRKFAQEYYLALLEKAKYEENPLKQNQIRVAVRQYLNDWEEDFSRQQALLRMVQKAYQGLDEPDDKRE